MRFATLLIALFLTGLVHARPDNFRVMTWNIWHGGREDGTVVGPRKVADVIRDSGADIVALQETYGSGERLAATLGFQFHPRGTNVSILSRYPVLEDISVFQEFKCAGALVQLPSGSKVAFYSIWLPYSGEIWEEGTRNSADIPAMLAACQASAVDLAVLRAAILDRLSTEKYRGVPIIIAGDFNSMSHLDYSVVAKSQYQAVVNWPTSRILIDDGFRDSYRETNPTVYRSKDRTWTPRFPKQEQDRIDFIYYRGAGLSARSSEMIDSHPDGFPSDHAAVVTAFRLDPNPTTRKDLKVRVASYNIKHGRGMDDKVDLARPAAVLRLRRPDIVGLQEVDLDVTRSGNQNQPQELGRRLGMHAAFGKFMDLQGGQYGMAILSRFPIRNVRNIELPVGNEPRVALAVEVQLPTGEALTIVNVHFDWVDDDRFRFAQASALANELRRIKTPYVLLGDFNDGPESRTLGLFRSLAGEATKPRSDRYTFSSVRPEKEIDFIFASPANRWQAQSVKVITEPLASDHRPVFAELLLRPSPNET